MTPAPKLNGADDGYPMPLLGESRKRRRGRLRRLATHHDGLIIARSSQPG